MEEDEAHLLARRLDRRVAREVDRRLRELAHHRARLVRLALQQRERRVLGGERRYRRRRGRLHERERLVERQRGALRASSRVDATCRCREDDANDAPPGIETPPRKRHAATSASGYLNEEPPAAEARKRGMRKNCARRRPGSVRGGGATLDRDAGCVLEMAMLRPRVLALGAHVSLRKAAQEVEGERAPLWQSGGAGAKPKSAPVARPGEEPQYEALYAWLGEASADLGKVAVADFDGLRGVMATEDIAKGETIVSIPGPCAVDLGTDHFDPVGPAQRLLDAMERDASTRAAYWATLPPADSPDLCTPDFFSESELELLQWPPLVASVNQKSAALRKALGDDADADALRRLRWATCRPRVLTVRGPDNAGHKLMIPFVDMFNHKAASSTTSPDASTASSRSSPMRSPPASRCSSCTARR